MRTTFLLLVVLFNGTLHAGAILISDFANNSVNVYDSASGAFSRTLVPSNSGPLDGASGIAVGPGGNVYVTSQNTNSIARFSLASGAYLGDFVASGSGGLSSPQDLVFGPDNNLWVVSSANDEILRFNGQTGAFLSVFATVDQPSLNGPINLRFGPDGNLYVTAFDGSRVLKLDGKTGAVLGVFLPPTGTTPGFVGEAFGTDGMLYVSAIDMTTFTGSINRYNPATLALTGTFVANGAGGLASPGGLNFDSAGNLLVLDSGNAGILRYGSYGAFLGVLVSDPANLAAPLFFTSTNAPEPSTFGMLAIAIAGLALSRCRRTQMHKTIFS